MNTIQKANILPMKDQVMGSRLLPASQQSMEPLLLKKSLSVSSLMKLTPDKETLQEARYQRGFSPQRLLAPVAPSTSQQRGDDFWDALCTHYNYLMDEGLIATCQEANNELSSKVEGSCDWSFTEFIQKFNELHDALHTLLSEVACITDAKDDQAAAGVLEKLQSVVFGCKQFKEQSQQLGQRYPDMKDEINRRVNLLTNKWETLEQAIHPHKPQPTQEALFNEVSHEMRCLRRWLRDVEDRLLPSLEGFYGWTLDHLQIKHQEQQVLQKEIESRGHLVSSLLHLCERLQQQQSSSASSAESQSLGHVGSLPWDAERVAKVAANLEKRWHALWLRSLEEQCRVEELIRKCKAGLLPSDPSLESSFGDEPPPKHPRLTGHPNFWSPRTMSQPENPQQPEQQRQNDKAVMVGSTGIAQLKAEYGTSPFGRFEIIQDVGYSSESSTHLSGEDNHDLIQVYSYSPATKGRTIVTEYKVLRDDKPKIGEEEEFAPLDASMDWQLTSEDDDDFFLDNLPAPIFASSPKKEGEEGEQKLDLSTSTTLVNRSLSEDLGGAFSVSDLVIQAEQLVRDDTRKRSLNQGVETLNRGKQGFLRSERVEEWLQECSGGNSPLVAAPQVCSEEASLLHTATIGNLPTDKDVARAVESSCDASGEYTTNESSENSGSESEGEAAQKQRRVRRLSHSGTGSVETVVPLLNPVAVGEDGSPQVPSSGCRVMLRSKKRNKRDRPWSVTELYQASNHLDLSPFSTSEGALNKLGTSVFRAVPGSASLHPRQSQEQIVPTANSPLHRHHRRHRSRASLPLQQSHHSSGCSVPTDCHSSSFSDGRSSDNRRGHSEGGAVPSSYCSGSSDSAQCSNSQCSCPSRHSSVNSQGRGGVYPGSQNSKSKKRKPTSSDDVVKVRERSSFKNTIDATSSRGLSTQLEDQSSVSDQAWDSYEDPPYLSEPYSEQTPDAEQVKRLIDFGDDYRAFISSDASSSVSGGTTNRTARGRSLTNQGSPGVGESDTDSDVEELQCLLQDSANALTFARNTLKAQRKAHLNGTIGHANSVELLATCQTHLKCLQVISQHLDPSYHLLTNNSHENLLQDLLSGWEMVQADVLSTQENGPQFQEVQKELESLKTKMMALAKVLDQKDNTYSSLEDIQNRITTLQNSLALLHETKTWLLSVNLKVHRFLTESGLTYSSMKDSVTHLYATWDDVYEQSGSQLTELQDAHNRWQQFTQDRQKLELLLAQEELEQGSLGKVDYWQVAERQTSWNQAEGLLVSLHGEAQTLRPFFRDQCQAWLDIKDHLQGLASRLQKIKEDNHLQVQELSRPTPIMKEVLPVIKAKVTCPKVIRESRAIPQKADEPKRRRSRFWRIIRAALPLQVALVLLYCLAWLMEPQCCDFLNSMHFTLSPTLRYLKGPPPT